MTLKDLLFLISEKSKELQNLIDLYNKELSKMDSNPIVKAIEQIFDKVQAVDVVEVKKEDKDKDNENNKS